LTHVKPKGISSLHAQGQAQVQRQRQLRCTSLVTPHDCFPTCLWPHLV